MQPIHYRESMLAGSRDLLKGSNKIVGILVTCLLTALAGLGGVALAMLIANALDANATWLALAGWLMGAGLYLKSFDILYADMARLSMARPLHRAPQTIIFDKAGLTFMAGPAVWKTPWSMIDAVIETKQTITLSVAGITFVLPKDAVGDAQAVKTLLDDLNTQIAHA